MAIKSKTPLKLKGASHRIFADSAMNPVVEYDKNNKVRSLQIKGLGMNHEAAYQIKLEVDKTMRLFNYKKK